MEQLPKTKIPRGREVTGASISAIVENKPQILRPIRPDGKNFVIPAELTTNAKFVLDGLFACFRKHKFIKEGVVSDILWGFVDVSAWPADRVAYGLVDLKRAGYISFVSPDNVVVDENCTKLKDCWVRYEAPLLALVEG
jgi:hypothetical protein